MLISALGKIRCRLLPYVGPEVLREWARYLEHAGLAILGAVPIMRDRGKGQREFPILQTFIQRDAERLCYFLYSSIAYSPVVSAMVTFTNALPG